MATASLASGILDRDNTDHRYDKWIQEATGRALWSANVTKKFLFHDSIEPNGATVWQRNVQATNTAAAALTEGEDLTNTQLNHTLVTIATAEVGAMTTISKWMTKSQVGQMREIMYWSEQLGRSMAKKIDADVTALFSSLNSGTCAGSGSGDTDVVAALESANFTLENNDATVGLGHNPVGVVHPRTISFLRQQIASTANVIFSDFASKTQMYADAIGWVGEFAGIDLWQTTNVPEITDAHRGAVFIPNHTFGFIENYGLQPFTDADPSLRAVEVGVIHAYGVGELEDKSGVCVSIESGT
jgi:hypothetical protein